MSQKFDIGRFRKRALHTDGQYELQLARLRNEGSEVGAIEEAVRGTLKNLHETNCRSFVIYGEPQSGKTEMMICLTAKLLDERHNFIIHLLNDSVDLLNQNLGRFKGSGLAPSARNFSEILDPDFKLDGRKHVVFCKKNARDLEKLIDKIGKIKDVVVIDDEADYASPNSRVNKGAKTRINELIEIILKKNGIYIGVTATPARLDLNNTFENDSGLWVNFPPHSHYRGQDVFFPIDGRRDYHLTLLPDTGDDPKHVRLAFFGFLVNVAYLNRYNNKDPKNYSILLHTSGKKVDHSKDYKEIIKTLSMLMDEDSDKYPQYIQQIWEVASKRYADVNPDSLTSYVIDNISRNSVIVINSDKDKSFSDGTATNPSSLFTIIIGGNIVSRGVTFNNLLSMFFTRDVKHKIQQDTYIQRARMFGSRGPYLKYFELTIPNQLYLDWHRCFVFHKLALAAIREKLGSPVWLGDKRIQAVASASIDRSTVDMDKGEMSFGAFNFDSSIKGVFEHDYSVSRQLDELRARVGDPCIPEYLLRFMKQTGGGRERAIKLHSPLPIESYKDADHTAIERKKGLMGQTLRDGPEAMHHLRVFYNKEGRARLFYKFNGSIQFIKNVKNG